MKNKTNKMMMLSAVMITSMALTGCSLQPHLELTSETQTVELGIKYKAKLEDWVGKEANQHILENTEMDTSKVKTDKVGKYPVEFSYTTKYTNKEETATGYVKVKDTTKPKFVDFKKQIKVEQNAQCIDMPKYFKATDISGDVEIDTDCKEKVNFKKPGKYNMTVKATDKNKNTSEKKCEVEIVASKSITTKTLGELTPYAVGEDSKDLPKVPVSEATETKVVEGKVSNKAVQPVATKGVEVKKGKYSTSEKQKAYEKKLAEEKKKKEEAKKKAEAERKAREEAQRKAEQQAQQQAYQDSFSEVYNQTQTYQPAYTQPTYTQPSAPTQQGGTGSSTTTTHKPAPITKPTQQPQACSVQQKGDYMTTSYDDVCNYIDLHERDTGRLRGYTIDSEQICGVKYFILYWH